MGRPTARRIERLAEELAEIGLVVDPATSSGWLLLEEVDRALRPAVHERRVSSTGTIVEPRSDPATWEGPTQLRMARKPLGEQPLATARLFADGRSCWLVRRPDADEWMVFDRPAGSERDLVVLAGALDATIVQRHPNGSVRIVGPYGVYRWLGYGWHHEPPVSTWIDLFSACAFPEEPEVLLALLEFAVHDLGSLGIGALLIYRPDDGAGPDVEERLPQPPPLHILQPVHLAPLRHALGQVDGAAMFDAGGFLRRLGVRLVPSTGAEERVDAFKGTRHTSGLRYSYDDPDAIVIAVSEDGPVSVLRNGLVLGRSPAPEPEPLDA